MPHKPTTSQPALGISLDAMLDQAHSWVCGQRIERSHNNSIWDVRFNLLDQLKLKMHPDKTFIGCMKKGFDFLGVHFCDAPEISKNSLNNHRSKLAQRYAQGAGVLKCCNNSETNPMGRESNRNHGLMGQTMENYHEKIYCEITLETAHHC